MWEKLLTNDIIDHILRITTIVLGGIGTIYIPDRQIGIKMSKRTMHIIGMVSMFCYSMVITIIYHQTTPLQMWWETLIFWLIANVAFVSIGYDLYKRIDHFLDRRLGKNGDTGEFKPIGDDSDSDSDDTPEDKPTDSNEG